ncbi:vegetative cell wall protein gp1-like [Vitis riparia]|uniref:vegetative cell wall protein gp1-like n=1 Tax=Vitis riparia TaxID=96939 RepID=UPI00155B2798|nr:vegetative cell wall protein gp1-like [Vitis riparia]
MTRTRGAKSSSPSTRKRTPREAPVQASSSEPPRPEAVPPPAKPSPKKRQAKPALQTPPARHYLTRSGGRPLQKRAKVESSEPIDLTGQSLVSSPVSSPIPSPIPSPMPSPAPPAKLPAIQPPPAEPQIPSEPALEAIIRRPILAQPPIEGNLDCRDRPFHSELCFDIAAFQLRPELEETFQLLRRYRMEQFLTPRDFFYPRIAMDFYQSMTTRQVKDPTSIHFVIDGRHGILGARQIAEALNIPYEPSHFDDFRA